MAEKSNKTTVYVKYEEATGCLITGWTGEETIIAEVTPEQFELLKNNPRYIKLHEISKEEFEEIERPSIARGEDFLDKWIPYIREHGSNGLCTAVELDKETWCINTIRRTVPFAKEADACPNVAKKIGGLCAMHKELLPKGRTFGNLKYILSDKACNSRNSIKICPDHNQACDKCKSEPLMRPTRRFYFTTLVPIGICQECVTARRKCDKCKI